MKMTIADVLGPSKRWPRCRLVAPVSNNRNLTTTLCYGQSLAGARSGGTNRNEFCAKHPSVRGAVSDLAGAPKAPYRRHSGRRDWSEAMCRSPRKWPVHRLMPIAAWPAPRQTRKGRTSRWECVAKGDWDRKRKSLSYGPGEPQSPFDTKTRPVYCTIAGRRGGPGTRIPLTDACSSGGNHCGRDAVCMYACNRSHTTVQYARTNKCARTRVCE
jgi:hypothetical protein